jgi:hypothetical protein
MRINTGGKESRSNYFAHSPSILNLLFPASRTHTHTHTHSLSHTHTQHTQHIHNTRTTQSASSSIQRAPGPISGAPTRSKLCHPIITFFFNKQHLPLCRFNSRYLLQSLLTITLFIEILPTLLARPSVKNALPLQEIQMHEKPRCISFET